MLKKHSIVLSLLVAMLLLFTAACFYPGGSQYDPHAVGYNWKRNYLSNLFSPLAVNGANNASRPWAVCGMFFLTIGFALFFVEFSKKIPLKTPAGIIRYFGAGAMLFAFLTVTPWHDIMITITSTMALVSMFYITVFVFKSKLQLLKILSVLSLLALYICVYIYYSGNFLEILAVMQKTSLGIGMIWIVALNYTARAEDFEHIKK